MAGLLTEGSHLAAERPWLLAQVCQWLEHVCHRHQQGADQLESGPSTADTPLTAAHYVGERWIACRWLELAHWAGQHQMTGAVVTQG